MHRELAVPNRMHDNLVSLFKAICKEMGISHAGLNDDFFFYVLLHQFSKAHNKVIKLTRIATLLFAVAAPLYRKNPLRNAGNL